jgi:hypothetical protein
VVSIQNKNFRLPTSNFWIIWSSLSLGQSIFCLSLPICSHNQASIFAVSPDFPFNYPL